MKKRVLLTTVLGVMSLLICIHRWHAGERGPQEALGGAQQTFADNPGQSVPTSAFTAPGSEPVPAAEPTGQSTGIPVELSAPEIERTADHMEYLEASWHAVLEREKSLEHDRDLVLSGDVSTSLWNRFRSRRFKDTALLTDWNQLARNPAFADVYGSSDASGRAQFERWKMLAGNPEDHVAPIRMAVLSGKCYASDLVYMRETQERIDDVDKAIDAAEPVITSFVKRYNAEFPEKQLELTPLRKHDVHRAKITPEELPVFVKRIDEAKKRIPPLLASAASYHERRLRFLNTIEAVAILGHDKGLRDLAANFEEKEHPFNSHGHEIDPHLPLKHPVVMKKAWDILTWQIPDLAVESPKRLEALSSVRDIATSEGGRLTIYDVESESEVETWTVRESDEIEKAERALDVFKELASEEPPLVAWDATIPSFTGEGFAPLDRRYRETGENWDNRLKATAANLSATLAAMDERLVSYGGQTSTPEALGKTLNELFKFEAMPAFWRNELRRMVPTHGTLPFRNFTLGPAFEVFTACQDFTAVAGGDDTWTIPCRINVTGEVRRIHLTIQVENYPLKSDKETFNRLYFELKSAKSGDALFDTPVKVQGLYVGQFRKGPAMFAWEPSDSHFNAAKEAVAHGMTVFIRCLTPNCKLSQGRVVVNYAPNGAATTEPTSNF